MNWIRNHNTITFDLSPKSTKSFSFTNKDNADIVEILLYFINDEYLTKEKDGCSHSEYKQVGESALYECTKCGHRIDISGSIHG